jgi:hypothetical protein
LAVAFVTGAIGLCLDGLGLVIVAFSQARRDPAAVAWIEAILAVTPLLRVRPTVPTKLPATPGGLAGNTLPSAAEAAGSVR